MLVKHVKVFFVAGVINFVLSVRFLELNVAALGQSGKSLVILWEFIIEPLVFLGYSFLHFSPPLFKWINPLQKVSIFKIVPI